MSGRIRRISEWIGHSEWRPPDPASCWPSQSTRTKSPAPMTSPSPMRLRLSQKPWPWGSRSETWPSVMSPWPSISRIRQARASSSRDWPNSAASSLMRQPHRTGHACGELNMYFAPASRALPLPIDRAAAQQQQRLIQHEATDADDDDRGVNVGEGEARAPDRDVVSEPDGVADHLRDDDDDDRHRQGDPQTGEDARQRRRKDHPRQDGGTAGAAILRSPDQPRLHRAEPEIARHHDRIETLDEGERDLRRGADAEDVGEDGEQRDLGDRVADEEDRLEQVADQHGPRHRRRERNADQRGEQEAGERPRYGHAGVVDQRAVADLRHQRGPDPAGAGEQPGFDEAARHRHLPD